MPSIKDAKIDGTYFITLQEGVEAANHDDKEESHIAFKAGIPFEGGETIFQHLINQQPLNIVTIERCSSFSYFMFNTSLLTI